RPWADAGGQRVRPDRPGPPRARNPSSRSPSMTDTYVFPPADASPPEVLELTPNSAANGTEGPHPQVSGTMYVHMKRPDGGAFLGPLANVEHYEAKGFTKGAEEDIPDLIAYLAAQAAAEPAAKAPATSSA